MLRRTSLVTLIALSGCADLDFDTACSSNPQLCAEEISADTASGDAQDETLVDSTSTDDSSLDSSIDSSTDDTSADTAIDDTSADSAPADADAETLADADSAPGDTLDAADAFDAADAKPDSDTGSDAAICTASAYSCSGAVLRQCNATGSGYTTFVTCPSAATCDPALKRCTACTPSVYSCSGAARQQCDTFGATTSTVATCATPELCTASTGATCKTPVCAVGEKRCGTKDVEICNAGRTGWTTSKSCSISCTALTCLDVVELAGARGGGGNHFCARLSDGTARCWGYGSYSIDGLGGVGPFTKPTAVAGLSNAVELSLGEATSGARLSDGTIKLWGDQLDYSGKGPTTLAGISGATSFALGGYFGCAVIAGGAVRCWGGNGSGQLGDGTTVDKRVAPYANTGISGLTSVATGGEMAFAIGGGSSLGWGAPAGALGTGLTTSPVKSPTTSFSGIVAVQGGVDHACAVQSDATVVCAGGNAAGQLGNGTKVDSSSAVKVTGLSGVTHLAVGAIHACAVSGGKVYCWGYNGKGQLGNGTTTDSASPTLVSGISSAVKVAAASGTTCALLSDQSVKCWGDNVYGELGAGLDGATVPQKTTPVSVLF
ncbi:MAG: RCC1 domain-containing protein [Polyangiales bacterium]